MTPLPAAAIFPLNTVWFQGQLKGVSVGGFYHPGVRKVPFAHYGRGGAHTEKVLLAFLQLGRNDIGVSKRGQIEREFDVGEISRYQGNSYAQEIPIGSINGTIGAWGEEYGVGNQVKNSGSNTDFLLRRCKPPILFGNPIFVFAYGGLVDYGKGIEAKAGVPILTFGDSGHVKQAGSDSDVDGNFYGFRV